MNNVRKVMFAAVIAALYVVMTVAWPLSFSGVQFRISEALTILPYFFPVAVPGLFVGCIIANLFSPFSFPDVFIGSLATLCAALLTMCAGRSRKSNNISMKVIACLPPILINAIFIGGLIAYYTAGIESIDVYVAAFVFCALSVGFGQMVVLFALGLPSLIYLPRLGVIEKLQSIYNNDKPQVQGDEPAEKAKTKSKESKKR